MQTVLIVRNEFKKYICVYFNFSSDLRFLMFFNIMWNGEKKLQILLSKKNLLNQKGKSYNNFYTYKRKKIISLSFPKFLVILEEI